MRARAEQAWARPEDDTWGARLQVRLAITHSAPLELVEAVVAEAQQACADSGRPAAELFGDADAYADEVAAERMSVEQRAAADMDGLDPADHVQGVLLASAFSGAVLSIVLIVARGWSVEVAPWQLVMLVAGHLAWAAAVAGELSRRAGLLRRSRAWWAVAVAALAGGTAIGMGIAEEPPLGELPTLVPLLAYLAVLVAAWRMPLAAPSASSDEAWAEAPAERWFEQLDGLLRGRYYLPRATAAAYVAEARTAWQESGAPHPAVELGSPQVYALQLVDGSVQHHRGRRRFQAWAATVVAALWTGVTVMNLASGETAGDLLWRGAATVFFVLVALAAWRDHLRDRSQAGGRADSAARP